MSLTTFLKHFITCSQVHYILSAFVVPIMFYSFFSVVSRSTDKFARGTIAKAMSEFHEKTCIRFVPRTIEKDYIHILKGDGWVLSRAACLRAPYPSLEVGG
uniref:Peptidase M12A domain-containing protein n=1 Tax=Scylla olivacea TaxID=85551 RepID=A0A0P4WFQ3_SCYOL